MKNLKDLYFPRSHAEAYLAFIHDRIDALGNSVVSLQTEEIIHKLSDQELEAFDGETFLAVIRCMKSLAEEGRPLCVQLHKYLQLTVHGSFGLSIITAANALESLLNAVENFDLIMPAVNLSLEVTEEDYLVQLSPTAEFLDTEVELIETVLGGFTSILPYVATEEMPVEINFTHSQAFPVEVYQDQWKIDGTINFNAPVNSISINKEFLQSELNTANKTSHFIVNNLLKDMKQRQKAEKSTSFRVKELIEKMLEEQTAITLDNIAEQLFVSTRTLSRRLKNEQATFGQLYSEVRLNKAREMLRMTRQPINQIANQCGYATVASFSKAFSKENVMSPMQYRKKLSSAVQ